MSKVRRYDLDRGFGYDDGRGAFLNECLDGEWMEYTDYAALQSKCEALERQIEESAEYRQKESEQWHNSMDALERELAVLRAPVSDEEWSGYASGFNHWRSTFDEMIAARATPPAEPPIDGRKIIEAKRAAEAEKGGSDGK